ncbi:hypothetical protein CS542_06540 [Pedobacter sp. IW39]|nr:hypothetical protein CS542_06540 [Pedobacter sp. IW39]
MLLLMCFERGAGGKQVLSALQKHIKEILRSHTTLQLEESGLKKSRYTLIYKFKPLYIPFKEA